MLAAAGEARTSTKKGGGKGALIRHRHEGYTGGHGAAIRIGGSRAMRPSSSISTTQQVAAVGHGIDGDRLKVLFLEKLFQLPLVVRVVLKDSSLRRAQAPCCHQGSEQIAAHGFPLRGLRRTGCLALETSTQGCALNSCVFAAAPGATHCLLAGYSAGERACGHLAKVSGHRGIALAYLLVTRYSASMSGKSTMSPEMIGILSVGVALAGLILSVVLIGGSWVVDSFRSLDARLDKVEQNQAVILERTRHLDPLDARSK